MQTISARWALYKIALLFLLLTLTTLHTVSAYAHGEPPANGDHPDHTGSGDTQAPSAAVLPLDRTCIAGAITQVDGAPLTHTLSILFTPYDLEGSLDKSAAVTTSSDHQGRFQLEQGLFPARWQVELQLPTGWEALTPTTFSVQLGFGRIDCATVNFQLRQLISVTVQKSDSNGAPLLGWKVRVQPGASNRAALVQEAVTDATGAVNLKLSSGLWLWNISAPGSATFRPVWVNGRQLQTYLTTPGPFTLKIALDGVRMGCINVHQHKMELTGEIDVTHIANWRIELQRADGAPVSVKNTNSAGDVSFINLPVGAYRVLQGSRSGWNAVAPTGFSVAVNSDETCAEVNFYNEPEPPGYCIQGRQVESNRELGLAGVKTTAKPLLKNGYQPNVVVTDGLGNYRFDFPIDQSSVPGARYLVCTEPQTGWQLRSASCTIVTLPRQPAVCIAGPTFKLSSPAGATGDTNQGCRTIHTVTHGEGLSTIGASYSVRFQAMLSANPWVHNRYRMYLKVGDQVCIP